jgi:hypothetical protein
LKKRKGKEKRSRKAAGTVKHLLFKNGDSPWGLFTPLHTHTHTHTHSEAINQQQLTAQKRQTSEANEFHTVNTGMRTKEGNCQGLSVTRDEGSGQPGT